MNIRQWFRQRDNYDWLIAFLVLMYIIALCTTLGHCSVTIRIGDPKPAPEQEPTRD